MLKTKIKNGNRYKKIKTKNLNKQFMKNKKKLKYIWILKNYSAMTRFVQQSLKFNKHNHKT